MFFWALGPTWFSGLTNGELNLGLSPKTLSDASENEAICWESVSKVAMLQTENPMQMNPVVLTHYSCA